MKPIACMTFEIEGKGDILCLGVGDVSLIRQMFVRRVLFQEHLAEHRKINLNQSLSDTDPVKDLRF